MGLVLSKDVPKAQSSELSLSFVMDYRRRDEYVWSMPTEEKQRRVTAIKPPCRSLRNGGKKLSAASIQSKKKIGCAIIMTGKDREPLDLKRSNTHFNGLFFPPSPAFDAAPTFGRSCFPRYSRRLLVVESVNIQS